MLSLGVELIVLVLFVARRFSDEAKDGERRERKGEKGKRAILLIFYCPCWVFHCFALTMNNKEQRNNNSVRSPPAPHCNG